MKSGKSDEKEKSIARVVVQLREEEEHPRLREYLVIILKPAGLPPLLLQRCCVQKTSSGTKTAQRRNQENVNIPVPRQPTERREIQSSRLGLGNSDHISLMKRNPEPLESFAFAGASEVERKKGISDLPFPVRRAVQWRDRDFAGSHQLPSQRSERRKSADGKQ